MQPVNERHSLIDPPVPTHRLSTDRQAGGIFQGEVMELVRKLPASHHVASHPAASAGDVDVYVEEVGGWSGAP